MKERTKNFNNDNKFTRLMSGLTYLFFATLFGAILFSYSPQDPSFSNATNNIPKNLLGVTGSYIADILLQIFGFVAGLFVIFPTVWGLQRIFYKKINYSWLRFIFALISIVSLSTFLVRYSGSNSLPFLMYGGAIGSLIRFYVINLNQDYVLVGEIIVIAVSLYIALNISIKSIILFFYQIFYYVFKVLKYLSVLVKQLQSSGNKLKDYDSAAQQSHNPEPMTKAIKDSANPNSQQASIVNHTLPPLLKADFEMPSSQLLNAYAKQKSNIPEKVFQEKSLELLQVLNDFGVHGKMISYSPGPVVTLYEFEPAAGIKSSRVISLSDDIARIMRAISTRIAVIPGKNSLGVELPNDIREVVYLRESVESKEYTSSHCKLPLILGKDIAGNNIIADLAAMPHLLVAGTTGSGKSVAINTMILSLLFRHTPEECKFVMIDPKMLELSIYQSIPHLLAPVVTEPGKAVIALKWTVKEMENRYRLMSQLNVRNIEGYNQKIEEAIAKNIDLSRKIQTGFDPETGKPIYETVEVEKKKLPFIVVIVDEMADLMIVAGKDIESSIQRLAQMARAAGIHLIMATQRPSVDVITGDIKANFPTRISFQVTSKIDSRTILGEMGAEQLLGKGDMLYMAGGNKVKRIHGPFVGDNEVEKVVSFLKSQRAPSYSVDITSEAQLNNDPASSVVKDELYDEALALIIREQKVSTSFLQRYFKIGYNKAATIIEQLEKAGAIGQPNHVGKREILINQ